MSDYNYNDNVRVSESRRKSGGKVYYESSFFSVCFNDMEKSMEDYPWVVRLSRYVVPGRCDEYCFEYSPSLRQGMGGRIRYYAEGMGSMPKAIEQLHKDLDKPQVIKLILDMCSPDRRRFSRDYRRNILTLLNTIAPKAKLTKKLDRLHKKQEVLMWSPHKQRKESSKNSKSQTLITA